MIKAVAVWFAKVCKASVNWEIHWADGAGLQCAEPGRGALASQRRWPGMISLVNARMTSKLHHMLDLEVPCIVVPDRIRFGKSKTLNYNNVICMLPKRPFAPTIPNVTIN